MWLANSSFKSSLKKTLSIGAKDFQATPYKPLKRFLNITSNRLRTLNRLRWA